MKLQNIKRLTREEVPEAPDWIEKVLTPFNQFMEQVTVALQGRLKFGDNLAGTIKTFGFSDNTELLIKNPLPQKPVGVIPIFSDQIIDTYRVRFLSSTDTTTQLGVTIDFSGSVTGLT